MTDDERQRLLMAKRAVQVGLIVWYNDAPYIPVELTTRYQGSAWVYGGDDGGRTPATQRAARGDRQDILWTRQQKGDRIR